MSVRASKSGTHEKCGTRAPIVRLTFPFGDGGIQRRRLSVAKHHLNVRPPAPLVEAPGRKGGMILTQIGPDLQRAGFLAFDPGASPGNVRSRAQGCAARIPWLFDHPVGT